MDWLDCIMVATCTRIRTASHVFLALSGVMLFFSDYSIESKLKTKGFQAEARRWYVLCGARHPKIDRLREDKLLGNG